MNLQSNITATNLSMPGSSARAAYDKAMGMKRTNPAGALAALNVAHFLARCEGFSAFSKGIYETPSLLSDIPCLSGGWKSGQDDATQDHQMNHRAISMVAPAIAA